MTGPPPISLFAYPDDPKLQSSTVRKVLPPGVSRAEVLAILRPPAKECMDRQLPDRDGRYEFCFTDDKLVSKRFVENPPPPPIVHHLECHHSLVLLFDMSSSALTALTRQLLGNFSGKCAAAPRRTVYIQGHDDSDGSSEANMQATRVRAEAVRDYLISLGFAPEQLRVEAYGNTKRLWPERFHTQNHRVEVFMP